MTIKARKQKLINSNNARENSKRIAHQYSIGDQILIKNDHNQKYDENAYSRPYVILRVNDNSTVRYQKGRIPDTINVRNITPFHAKD